MGWLNRRSADDSVRETVVAADVKARAELLLDQMNVNLNELRALILGGGDDDGRSGLPLR